MDRTARRRGLEKPTHPLLECSKCRDPHLLFDKVAIIQDNLAFFIRSGQPWALIALEKADIALFVLSLIHISVVVAGVDVLSPLEEVTGVELLVALVVSGSFSLF